MPTLSRTDAVVGTQELRENFSRAAMVSGLAGGRIAALAVATASTRPVTANARPELLETRIIASLPAMRPFTPTGFTLMPPFHSVPRQQRQNSIALKCLRTSVSQL